MPEYTSELIERAAEAAHEANRSYCKSIEDFSQAHWPDAAQWQLTQRSGSDLCAECAGVSIPQ
mgnify:CR=1 FL=1